MNDIIAFLNARYDEEERTAREAAPGPWEYQDVDSVGGGRVCDRTVAIATLHYDTPGEVDPRIRRSIMEAEADGTGAHIIRWDPARVLADLDAKRRVIAEHAPQWRTVEWPHDQNGKGEAQACRRCQNAEHTYWNPPEGEAGVLPEGFVTPYVLAPCLTLRLLALPHAGHPDYRPEWKPA